ncbi:Serine/threonine-protein kinase [Lachnellula willkommii]|uniref:Serine/threonine-protein kinase n=1 Tax=Lachnellula willkommii TaxID=215461 RepID=A0A559MFW7_9HELO|nr:Serine/threonine-protein kinase [Lachnellula willkommii]
MTSPRDQRNYEKAIQGIHSWMDRRYTYEVFDPEKSPPSTRPFMVLKEVQSYLTDNHHQKLKGIIDVLFEDSDGFILTDIIPDYVAVFCILLQISKGHYIKHFTRYGSLSDAKLPFDPRTPPQYWPLGDSDQDFLAQFCERQWAFCTPSLPPATSDKYFDSKTVLPITFKKTLQSGSSANLSLIHIHPWYNKLLPEQERREGLRTAANRFVLKTYFTKDAERYYQTEVAAFGKLRFNPNIIRFYGNFTRGDSYNILLEYADEGTLERYFEKQAPPRDGEEVINFWERLFKIIDALRGVHEVEPTTAGGPQIFQGCHHDVKPTNILVLSNGSTNAHEFQFKLADLGISNFKPKQKRSMTTSESGTRTYGAPELYRPAGTHNHQLPIRPDVDLWSLGCIFSEAVRWLVDGHHGVVEYRGERAAETSQIGDFRDGDCFHNGERPLKSVDKCHEKCVDGLIRKDFITHNVIEHMIPVMLEKSGDRLTARDLSRMADRFIIKAREGLRKASSRPTDSLMGPPPPPKLPPGKGAPGVRNINGLGISTLHYPTLPLQYSKEGTNTERKSTILNEMTSSSPEPMFESRMSTGDFAVRPQSKTGTSSFANADMSPLSEKVFRKLSKTRPDEQQRSHQRTGLRSSIQHTEFQRTPRGMHPSNHSGNGPLPRNDIFDDQSPGATAGIMSSHRIGTGNKHRRSHNGKEAFRRKSTSSDSDGLSAVEAPNNPAKSHEAAFCRRPFSALSSVPIKEVYELQTTGASSDNVCLDEPRMISNRLTPRVAERRQTKIEFGEITPPPSRLPRSPPPSQSIKDVLKWKRERKEDKFRTLRTREKKMAHWDLLERVKGRDHVFLIDDSVSMKPHWDKTDDSPGVVKVFEALSYLVKETDDDGIDLLFTVSGERVSDRKSTTKLVQLVKEREHQGNTDINLRVNGLFEDYKAEFNKRKNLFSKDLKKVKPLSLYIFTNGVWEEGSDLSEIIRRLVRKLEDVGRTREQVGIEFISFGADPVGLKRMEYLDSELDLSMYAVFLSFAFSLDPAQANLALQNRDIIDHEPSNGNVWKMLLGSFNNTWDNYDDLKRQSHSSSRTLDAGSGNNMQVYEK